MKSTEARPLFRVLAGVLSVFGGFGVAVIGCSELEESVVAAVSAFIGGGLFVLAMFFVAITGKVPLCLAYFLALPSAWKSEDRR